MTNQITILHTNDIHGRLDQMARLATMIRAERSRTAPGGQVLLLDAGDSGEKMVWESDVTQGRANYVLLEAMAYQATTLGEADALPWGPQALARLVHSVNMPVLAANLLRLGNHEPAVPGLKSHTWLRIGPLQIAVLGLTAPVPGYERCGLRVAHPVPIARRLADQVRSEGAHLVILLSHLGFMPDGERRNTEEIDDLQLARAVPGIDVIVGGHSHTILESPVRVGNTVIVQAGAFGQYLGRLDLLIDLADGRIVDAQGSLIPVPPSTPYEPTAEAVLELVREEATRLTDRRGSSLSQP